MRAGAGAGEVIMLIITQRDLTDCLENELDLLIRSPDVMQIDSIFRFGNLLIPNKEMRTIPTGLIPRCIAVHDNPQISARLFLLHSR